MFCARSLRRQITNLRALSSLCCQQVTQPEAQFSTMAAVAEPETKRAKTEYSHTREVGDTARQWQQPRAATCNRMLQALAQPGVSDGVAQGTEIIYCTVCDNALHPSNVLGAVCRRSLMCMLP
jgi:hypothetical protein